MGLELHRTAYQFDEWVDACPWPQVNPVQLAYIPTNYILSSVDLLRSWLGTYSPIGICNACCQNTHLVKLNCIFLDILMIFLNRPTNNDVNINFMSTWMNTKYYQNHHCSNNISIILCHFSKWTLYLIHDLWKCSAFTIFT